MYIGALCKLFFFFTSDTCTRWPNRCTCGRPAPERGRSAPSRSRGTLPHLSLLSTAAARYLDPLRPAGSAGSRRARASRRMPSAEQQGEGHCSRVRWWSRSKVLSLNCLWTISAGLLPRVGGSAGHRRTPCIWIVM